MSLQGDYPTLYPIAPERNQRSIYSTSYSLPRGEVAEQLLDELFIAREENRGETVIHCPREEPEEKQLFYCPRGEPEEAADNHSTLYSILYLVPYPIHYSTNHSTKAKGLYLTCLEIKAPLDLPHFPTQPDN